MPTRFYFSVVGTSGSGVLAPEDKKDRLNFSGRRARVPASSCASATPVCSSGLQARAVCWGPAVHPRRALQGQSRNAPVFPSGHLPSTPLQDIPEAERRDPAHRLLPGSCSAACSSPPAPMHTVGEGWPRDSAAQGWVVALRWPHSQKGKVPKFLGTGCGGR